MWLRSCGFNAAAWPWRWRPCSCLARPPSPRIPCAPDAEQKAEASAHLKRGAELIDAENLEGALAEFEAAYRLVPSPSILHNFGVVYQGLGRKAAALEAFERFLAEAAKAPPATREHAQQAAQTLRAEVAQLRVQSDHRRSRHLRRRQEGRADAAGKADLPGPGPSSRVH